MRVDKRVKDLERLFFQFQSGTLINTQRERLSFGKRKGGRDDVVD